LTSALDDIAQHLGRWNASQSSAHMQARTHAVQHADIPSHAHTHIRRPSTDVVTSRPTSCVRTCVVVGLPSPVTVATETCDISVLPFDLRIKTNWLLEAYRDQNWSRPRDERVFSGRIQFCPHCQSHCPNSHLASPPTLMLSTNLPDSDSKTSTDMPQS